MSDRIQTADQLLRASALGRCELVRGELAVMHPTGGRHGRVAMRIGRAIADFVERNELGEVFAAETGFILTRDPDTVRAPDAAFVRRGCSIGDGFIDGAPALAVEVMSPSDRPGYLREKVAEWLEAGAEAVWVVDPREESLTVHGEDASPLTLCRDDDLSGGRVLPGFVLPLARLFAT